MYDYEIETIVSFYRAKTVKVKARNDEDAALKCREIVDKETFNEKDYLRTAAVCSVSKRHPDGDYQTLDEVQHQRIASLLQLSEPRIRRLPQANDS